MAMVEEAMIGKDGIVRDVILKYKNLKEGKSYNGQSNTRIKRSAHSLVLLLPVEEQGDFKD